MTLRNFEGITPTLEKGAWVDESAVVIGDVHLGPDSSVWPLCVIRGDIHSIRIGARTNIQDGSILHVTHDSHFNPGGYPLTVGDDVIVGHQVVLHGCTIEDRCLIGMGARILDGAVVRSGAIIAAGALVPQGKECAGGYVWVGSPVRRGRTLSEAEIEHLAYSANQYVMLKDRHQNLPK